MRQELKFWSTILFVVLWYCCHVAAQDKTTFVFRHVKVIPMNKNTVLPDRDVVIKDGIIKEIGSPASVKTPKGAHTINARGKFLIPALSDMHVHLEGDAWNIMFPPGSKRSQALIHASN